MSKRPSFSTSAAKSRLSKRTFRSGCRLRMAATLAGSPSVIVMVHPLSTKNRVCRPIPAPTSRTVLLDKSRPRVARWSCLALLIARESGLTKTSRGDGSGGDSGGGGSGAGGILRPKRLKRIQLPRPSYRASHRSDAVGGHSDLLRQYADFAYRRIAWDAVGERFLEDHGNSLGMAADHQICC